MAYAYDKAPRWDGSELHRFRAMPGEDLGRFGERLWRAVFEAAGLSYIPLHKIADGGAPVQRGPEGIILPDFEVSSARFNIYADSKAKRHPVVYRHAQEERHGIDRPNWNHYVTISERSRRACCLALFECFRDEENTEWSGALLVQSLYRLGEPLKGHGTQPHMVYWPRARFAELGGLNPGHAAKLYRPAMNAFRERLWDILEISDRAPKQGRLF